ncbi:MAG: hypothetical protein JNN15_13955 [Blastocatellia bacterium]|nr:hypothetical protein [Blastocatellia bacterium]
MAIKVENLSTINVKTDLDKLVNQVFDTVPKEHTRGISKVVFVDEIKDPRLLSVTTQPQPVLYHPKTPGSQAFIEISLSFLLPKKENFIKRLAARANLKANIAGALLASIGQHYHLNFSHGIKKTQYESRVRSYVEKYFVEWREQTAGFRAKLFKPLRPYFEKLDKWMKKKMLEQQKPKKGK